MVVQMPHMSPGERLSEIELLKWLGAFQWESISRALGQQSSQIMNAQDERLYASFINIELQFTAGHSQKTLGEDVTLHVANSVRFYAKKFVEGLFVIDTRPISQDQLVTIESRQDLAASKCSWAYTTNAFIAREGSNTKLKVFKPKVEDDLELQDLREPPDGIVDHARVQASGEMVALVDNISTNSTDNREIQPTRLDSIIYDIIPENDLNGAGLLYFARYIAMMNYGERVFLSERVEPPISTHLISFLSTQHRKVFFFANATPEDKVEVRVTATLLLPGDFEKPVKGLPYRVPLQMLLHIDLHRASDKVLMASSLVQKSLNVPGHRKDILLEADRFLRLFS
jgi:probable biosynthetic protein (TIGR04098 family)